MEFRRKEIRKYWTCKYQNRNKRMKFILNRLDFNGFKNKIKYRFDMDEAEVISVQYVLNGMDNIVIVRCENDFAELVENVADPLKNATLKYFIINEVCDNNEEKLNKMINKYAHSSNDESSKELNKAASKAVCSNKAAMSVGNNGAAQAASNNGAAMSASQSGAAIAANQSEIAELVSSNYATLSNKNKVNEIISGDPKRTPELTGECINDVSLKELKCIANNKYIYEAGNECNCNNFNSKYLYCMYDNHKESLGILKLNVNNDNYELMSFTSSGKNEGMHYDLIILNNLHINQIKISYLHNNQRQNENNNVVNSVNELDMLTENKLNNIFQTIDMWLLPFIIDWYWYYGILSTLIHILITPIICLLINGLLFGGARINVKCRNCDIKAEIAGRDEIVESVFGNGKIEQASTAIVSQAKVKADTDYLKPRHQVDFENDCYTSLELYEPSKLYSYFGLNCTNGSSIKIEFRIIEINKSIATLNYYLITFGIIQNNIIQSNINELILSNNTPILSISISATNDESYTINTSTTLYAYKY